MLRCSHKCRFLIQSIRSFGGRCQNPHFHKFFVSAGPQVPRFRCHWCVMSDEPNIKPCFSCSFFFWLEKRLPPAQNRLSPCQWESGDLILWAHAYLSATDISGSSGACPGEGIWAPLNRDNPGSGHILWYYIHQLTFSPCIYNYSTVSMH